MVSFKSLKLHNSLFKSNHFQTCCALHNFQRMHNEQLMVDGAIMDEQINLNDLQVPRQFEGEQISRLTSFWIKNAFFQNWKTHI